MKAEQALRSEHEPIVRRDAWPRGDWGITRVVTKHRTGRLMLNHPLSAKEFRSLFLPHTRGLSEVNGGAAGHLGCLVSSMGRRVRSTQSAGLIDLHHR